MEPTRIDSLVAITSTLPAIPGDGTPEFVLTFAKATPVSRITIVAPMMEGARSVEGDDKLSIRRFRYALRRSEELASEAILPTLRSRPTLARQLPGLLTGLVFASRTEVRRSRPQLVHAHWIVPGGLVALVVKKLTGTPYVVSAHGADAYALNGRVGTWLKRRVMRGSLAVYPVSSEIGALLARIEPGSVGPVVSMGVEVSALRDEAGSIERQDRKGIVFVGRLADKKGIDVLLAALARTSSKAPLQVIGDGPARAELQEQATALGIGDRVAFSGKQTHRQVVEALASAEVAVVPSVKGAGGDQDGTPVVLMEAMALGTPVVASSLGGIADHLTDNANGLLAPPGDIDAVTSAIDRLLSDSELAARLGDAGERYAREHFDVGRLAECLISHADKQLNEFG